MIGINLTLIAFLFLAALTLIVISFRYPMIFALGLILFDERLLGIVPYTVGSSQYDVFRYFGVALLLAVLLFQFVFLGRRFIVRFKIAIRKNTYGKYIFMILFIVVFCTIWGGYIIFHQPLKSLILRPVIFFYYFLYFYLCLFDIKKQEIIRFFNAILVLAIIVAFLSAIDAFFFQGAKFFGYAHTSERMGHVRKVLFVFSMLWAYYYGLVRSFNKDERTFKKICFGLSSLILLMNFIFVQASRQVLLSCAVATLLFLWHKGLMKLFFSGIVLISIILASYIYHDYTFSNTYLGKMYQYTNKEVKKSKSNITVRINAIKYYYKFFKKSYLLGFGLMSTNSKYKNPVSKGLLYYGYNLNDISLCGIIFQFGIQALLVIIVLIIKLFRDINLLLSTIVRDTVNIATSIKYLIIHLVIIFPLTTVFFYKEKAIYYAIMLFIIDRLKELGSSEEKGIISKWST